jgi:dienelactone hydrolase
LLTGSRTYHHLFPTRRRLRAARAAVPLSVTLLGWLPIACDSAQEGQDIGAERGGRGALVSVTPIIEMGVSAVRDYVARFGLDPTSVARGVKANRLVYRTIDTAGLPTTASTLVVVPEYGPLDVPVVSWMHGTTVYRHEVASENEDSSDRGAAFLFASAGYVASAPDYLGLGAGPGLHPYDHFASAATASVDALRAVRTFVARAGGALAPEVMVAGFSQGGPSAMALAHSLQDGADPQLHLSAVAALSGPFDVSGTLATALTGQLHLSTAYVAYLVVAWNRIDPLYKSTADAFLPPYTSTVEALFDGDHLPQDVLAQLPETLDALFTSSFLASLRHPEGALAGMLQTADATCDWQPTVPVWIYAAAGDKDVPFENSVICQHHLSLRGVDVAVADLGDIEHDLVFARGLPSVLTHFDSVRAGASTGHAVRSAPR